TGHVDGGEALQKGQEKGSNRTLILQRRVLPNGKALPTTSVPAPDRRYRARAGIRPGAREGSNGRRGPGERSQWKAARRQGRGRFQILGRSHNGSQRSSARKRRKFGRRGNDVRRGHVAGQRAGSRSPLVIFGASADFGELMSPGNAPD